MEVRPLSLPGLLELIPRKFEDERGYFFESYNQQQLAQLGIPENFVQDNQSFSSKGVIRGLHFQKPPFAQAKLVRVVVGRALDVVMDLREGSPSFGKAECLELSGDKHNMLYVPVGFAHGFSALTDCIFQYKCSNYYDKNSESGIIYNDKSLNINWHIDDPVVSSKDLELNAFSVDFPVFTFSKRYDS